MQAKLESSCWLHIDWSVAANGSCKIFGKLDVLDVSNRYFLTISLSLVLFFKDSVRR
jgi:hypothetical protein